MYEAIKSNEKLFKPYLSIYVFKIEVKKKKELELETILTIIFLIISFSVFGYYSYKYWDIVSDPEAVQEIISSFGPWAPIAYIISSILQVILAYLPGIILSVVGGYIWGKWIGFLLNLIGVTIGSMLAYYIAHKLGKPIIERMFNESDIYKFNRFFRKHGLIIIFLARAQFIFPNDIVSYASGLLHGIRWRGYLIATVLGFIPHLLLVNSIGNELQNGFFTVQMISYAVVVLFIMVIYIFRSPIYKFILKEEEIIEKKISLRDKSTAKD
jgi:uncharacterized membrane protein YdjX (TVP38/TMEM64 family)|tara:strand:+ start:99 stop:905 length:807 start_codon:yes stop_codon:yes gene_type:complete